MPDARRGEENDSLDAGGLRQLLDVSRRILAEARPDALLATIVDSLVAITGADRGFLMLRRPGGELAFTIARDKQGRPLEAGRFKVSLGVVNEVAESGESRLIDDAASLDAYQARKSIVSLNLRTILCVPLTSPHGVLGVIYVDSIAITRRFTAGDVPLVEAFAAQAAAAVERLRLQEAERERDRMRQQLEVAAEIQQAFLPRAFPTLPGVRGALAQRPALEVGGDFHDVLRLPDGRVGVLVGDVAGKGVPGALFGARMISDVRYEALYRDDVAGTLEALNALVAERATRGMFVTLLYAVVDPARGTVAFANAGHLAPLVRQDGGAVRAEDAPVGLPLGVVGDARYEAGALSLGPRETLVLLSDGIPDAQGPQGARFGRARVEAALAGGPGDPEGLVDSLLDAVAAFADGRPQVDDQTLLALRLA